MKGLGKPRNHPISHTTHSFLNLRNHVLISNYSLKNLWVKTQKTKKLPPGPVHIWHHCHGSTEFYAVHCPHLKLHWWSHSLLGRLLLREFSVSLSAVVPSALSKNTFVLLRFYSRFCFATVKGRAGTLESYYFPKHPLQNCPARAHSLSFSPLPCCLLRLPLPRSFPLSRSLSTSLLYCRARMGNFDRERDFQDSPLTSSQLCPVTSCVTLSTSSLDILGPHRHLRKPTETHTPACHILAERWYLQLFCWLYEHVLKQLLI